MITGADPQVRAALKPEKRWKSPPQTRDEDSLAHASSKKNAWGFAKQSPGSDLPSRCAPRGDRRASGARRGVIGVHQNLFSTFAGPSMSTSRRDAALAELRARTAGFAGLPLASASDVISMQQGGRDVILIDVRSPPERAVSTLPGALDQHSFAALAREEPERVSCTKFSTC